MTIYIEIEIHSQKTNFSPSLIKLGQCECNSRENTFVADSDEVPSLSSELVLYFIAPLKDTTKSDKLF